MSCHCIELAFSYYYYFICILDQVKAEDTLDVSDRILPHILFCLLASASHFYFRYLCPSIVEDKIFICVYPLLYVTRISSCPFFEFIKREIDKFHAMRISIFVIEIFSACSEVVSFYCFVFESTRTDILKYLCIFGLLQILFIKKILNL